MINRKVLTVVLIIAFALGIFNIAGLAVSAGMEGHSNNFVFMVEK